MGWLNRKKGGNMRNETLRLADDCIAYVVINPIEAYGYEEWNGSNEKLNIKEIAKSIYEEMLVQAEDTFGYSKAIRFDGKKNIMAHIQNRLPELMKESGFEEYI